MKAQALADHLAESHVNEEYQPLSTYFPDEEVSVQQKIKFKEKHPASAGASSRSQLALKVDAPESKTLEKEINPKSGYHKGKIRKAEAPHGYNLRKPRKKQRVSSWSTSWGFLVSAVWFWGLKFFDSSGVALFQHFFFPVSCLFSSVVFKLSGHAKADTRVEPLNKSTNPLSNSSNQGWQWEFVLIPRPEIWQEQVVSTLHEPKNTGSSSIAACAGSLVAPHGRPQPIPWLRPLVAPAGGAGVWSFDLVISAIHKRELLDEDGWEWRKSYKKDGGTTSRSQTKYRLDIRILSPAKVSLIPFSVYCAIIAFLSHAIEILFSYSELVCSARATDIGLYIKDIQKEQLKITLWNEEILLEDVELILEASNYLQLPLDLKQGHVGKLSIKIPWKKLGWDPVIISLEDILVCASQRDEKEWRMDEVERREFAGKKAKLAAAELAKLSRRVCDSRAGNSFTSYITAKVLDNIQLSIRKVHILYRDMLTSSAVTVFGMKLSSLTIMRQLVSGKMRDGRVNKLVEIKGLELYCSTYQSTDEVMRDYAVDSNSKGRELEANDDKYMLVPLDVSLSLS
uniref:Uncharacterized protein LOC104228469 n=1 Tax=Nicotiana sylvestris TaxID=4096 RepID=A0A1U7WPK3_NICSY